VSRADTHGLALPRCQKKRGVVSLTAATKEKAIGGDSPDDPFVELVHKTASGDVDAWAQLWIAVSAQVIRFIASRLRKPIWHPLVEDIASVTMERIRLVAPNFRGESRVKTWIIGIARLIILEHWNKDQAESTAGHRLLGATDESGPPPGAGEAGGETFDLMDELIGDLPPAQERAMRVDLDYSDKRLAREGLSPAEAAAHRQNVSRAKRRLLSRINTEQRYAPLRRFLPRQAEEDRDG
jgi:DNA-directed RNA polymerase specialized sigma24 family protein